MVWNQFLEQIHTLTLHPMWKSQQDMDKLLVDNVTAVCRQRGNLQPIVESMGLHDIMSLWSLLDRIVTRMSNIFLKSPT
jgi:hypothetical protein